MGLISWELSRSWLLGGSVGYCSRYVLFSLTLRKPISLKARSVTAHGQTVISEMVKLYIRFSLLAELRLFESNPAVKSGFTLRSC